MRRLLVVTFASVLASTAAQAGAPKSEVPTIRYTDPTVIVGHRQEPLVAILPVRQDVTTAVTVAVPNAPLTPKIEQAVALSTF